MKKRRNYYPKRLQVSPKGDDRVLRNLKKCYTEDEHFSYAEFGIYKGATAEKVLETFPNANVHLFDFERNITEAQVRLMKYQSRITFYENSLAYLDSYNWNLMHLLKQEKREFFDYVFLDGAHVWAVDGLTFFLCDMLLSQGGYIEFDDVDWTLRGSSLDPKKNKSTKKFYTEEQIDATQVELIIELLVKKSGKYKEISENRLFKKFKLP